MKKFILFSVALSLMLSTQAQITVSSTYIATLGDTFLAWKDTTNGPTLDLGNAAGNQIWDFSALLPQKEDGAILQDPSTAPFIRKFPRCNFCGERLNQ